MEQDSVGGSALHLATIDLDVEAVKRLLSQNVNPNSSGAFGGTPLHYLCENLAKKDRPTSLKMLLLLRLFLDNGGSVNITDNKGDTPLHCAARSGSEDAVELLLVAAGLENGDKTVLRYVQTRNDEGKSPRDVALEMHHVRVARTLVLAVASAGKFQIKGVREQEGVAPSGLHGEDMVEVPLENLRSLQSKLPYLQQLKGELEARNEVLERDCASLRSKEEGARRKSKQIEDQKSMLEVRIAKLEAQQLEIKDERREALSTFVRAERRLANAAVLMSPFCCKQCRGIGQYNHGQRTTRARKRGSSCQTRKGRDKGYRVGKAGQRVQNTSYRAQGFA